MLELLSVAGPVILCGIMLYGLMEDIGAMTKARAEAKKESDKIYSNFSR